MSLTNRDLELLAAAFKSLKGEAVVDYNVFATRGGFKNANSAKAAWHTLKKKLEKFEAGNDDITDGASPPKKRKGSATDEAEEQGGEKSPKKAKNTNGEDAEGTDGVKADGDGEA